MTYLLFDTETTGLQRCRGTLSTPVSVSEFGDEVLQIGGLVFDEKLEVSRAFCHYCDILTPESSPSAFAVHQILMESIRDYIPGVFLEEVVFNLIPEMFLPDVTYVGYNVDFDLQMVAQGMRSFSFRPDKVTPVIGSTFKHGVHSLDILKYLPKRRKLAQFQDELRIPREAFFDRYAGRISVETNVPELFKASWSHAHNALFDSIEAYLVLSEVVWRKKLLVV